LSKATDVEREEKRRRIKNISGFELKIDFGFNIKEIALPLSTSSYRDSIIKQNLQCKIKYFFNQLNRIKDCRFWPYIGPIQKYFPIHSRWDKAK